jgi:predicted DNA-binding protein with PD1-like motif
MKWSRRTFGLATVLLAASATVQGGQDEWISPSHSIATGKAPGMKVQLLSDDGKQKTYAVIFSKGDEAFSGLTDFARQYNVTAAHFTAIGALNGAELGWFNPARKMYKAIPIQAQVEVLSMIGDIALYKGKPAVHTHVVVGFQDGSTRGGHVIEAHVNPTLEVMVTVEPNSMHKRLDPETDLTLIDPDTKN